MYKDLDKIKSSYQRDVVVNIDWAIVVISVCFMICVSIIICHLK